MLASLFFVIIVIFPSLASGEILSNLTAIESSIDGKYLFMGDIDGNLYKWDIDNNKIIHKMKVHKGKMTVIFPVKDENLIFTASFDNSISIIKNNETISFLMGHKGPVTSLTTIPQKALLISGSSDMTVRIWDIKTSSLIKTYDKFGSVITSVVSYGDSIYVGTSEGYVYIVNISDDEVLSKINLHDSVISSLSVHNEKGYLLSSSWDRTIAIWHIKDKKLLNRCKGHGFWVTSVVNIKDKILSAGSLDYSLRIWNLEDCKEIMKIKGLESYVVRAIYSRDERYIFSLTLNDGIRQWNALTGEMIQKITN